MVLIVVAIFPFVSDFQILNTLFKLNPPDNWQPTTDNKSMNYFDFYNIPMTFKPDAAALKKQFYANSKKYHPDFFTTESEEKQAEILELSTLNNRAYKTLKDPDARMKYILDETGVYGKEGENKLPQDFLTEMMDINEEIMDLQFDFDAEKYAAAMQKIEAFEKELYGDVDSILKYWTKTTGTDEDLEKVKNFYLKKKYLLRIRENVSTFAPA